MSPIELALPPTAEFRLIMHYAQSRDYRCHPVYAKPSSRLIMHYARSRDYRRPESGLPLPGVGIIVAHTFFVKLVS